MIKMRDLLKEVKVFSWAGAQFGKKGERFMCHRNSRIYYFKHKSSGVKYCEGHVLTTLEDGKTKSWIEHAWNLKDNKVIDMTYGENIKEYKGSIVKDEWMLKIPEWFIKVMKIHNQRTDDPKEQYNFVDDYKSINIRVSKEFGKKVFE